MLLLSVQNLARQFGSEPVFRGLSFSIYGGDRVGLVGANGAGKTTLLRLLVDQDQPDVGSVRRHGDATVGLLEQEPKFAVGRTVFEEAGAALAPLQRMHDEMIAAAAMLGQTDGAQRRALERKYDHLAERLHSLGAYHLDHRIERILEGLGFETEQFTQPVEKLSGGEQCRLMLAQLLLAAPDVLLMDEPSNHLDIDATRWLEEWLTSLPQGMLLVSHDRYFLDRVATKIFEMNGGRIEEYTGNFSAYQQQRTERALVQARTFEAQQAYIADQEDYIRRYHYGQRATQAKDREKKLARIQAELVERPTELRGPAMGFAAASRSGDVVVQANELAKQFDRPLFRDLTFSVERGERLGIIGPNGCGKSTLLRVLLGMESPSAGTARLGHKVVVGYYDQKLEMLPLDQTAIEAAWPRFDPKATEGTARALLARFGLTGDRVSQRVRDLSGGEKSRVALVRLVISHPNLLVLDEPTNHLDIWAREALERALQEFDGTLVVVSHDRYFLDSVVNRLLVVGSERSRLLEGNFSRYLELLARESAAATSDARTTAVAERPNKSRAPRKRKFPYRKVVDIETDIAQAEQAVIELETRLADPALYRDGEQVRSVRDRYDSLKVQLASLYEHWEEAAELNG